MHASESLHCRNLRMAHYIRRNLPQKCCGLPHYWIPWRNAKLIHEPTGRSPLTCSLACQVVQRGVQRMNEIKTNAADAAAALRSVDSIHSVRKLVYQRILTNNCPISQ
jgi:hypothetical protein